MRRSCRRPALRNRAVTDVVLPRSGLKADFCTFSASQTTTSVLAYARPPSPQGEGFWPIELLYKLPILPVNFYARLFSQHFCDLEAMFSFSPGKLPEYRAVFRMVGIPFVAAMQLQCAGVTPPQSIFRQFPGERGYLSCLRFLPHQPENAPQSRRICSAFYRQCLRSHPIVLPLQLPKALALMVVTLAGMLMPLLPGML